MMLKAIIFDLDGVLIDSYLLIKTALKYSYNIVVGPGEPPYESFFRHMGDSLGNIFQKVNLPQEMLPFFLEKSVEIQDQIVVESPIFNMLESCKQLGLKIGICTGKDSKRTHLILKQTGILPYLSSVVCSDTVNNPKPYPDSLIQGMFDLKVQADETLMVGDAPNDIRCAKGASVESIAALWYCKNPQLLLESDPTYICHAPNQLVQLIESQDRKGEFLRVTR